LYNFGDKISFNIPEATNKVIFEYGKGPDAVLTAETTHGVRMLLILKKPELYARMLQKLLTSLI